MRNELKKILASGALGNFTRDSEGNFVPLDWSGTPDEYFDEAIDQILAILQPELEKQMATTIFANKINISQLEEENQDMRTAIRTLMEYGDKV